MSIIKLLPDNLINQIAAGEVVERPSCVVKELVENSIDAGAKNIVIEIENSGSSLIKITDDGKGMSVDDLKMALERHATSKIISENDLWNISTLGFRGEALASISSVSQLSIASKHDEDISGNEINADGGEIINLKEVGIKTGTQIEVRSLFFNTPARKKYLKKDTTEFGHISALVSTISMANLGVGFKLFHNGKLILDLPKVNDFLSRISDIYGSNTAGAMVPIFYGGVDMKMDGYIGKPSISRSSTKHQHFFVNGRAIRHNLFANMIKQAYKSMLMEHRSPVFFINIQIDPSKIDVNVHPKKLEIRFEDQQRMIKLIYSAVKAALDNNDLTPKAFTESRRYMSDSFPEKDDEKSFGTISQSSNYKNFYSQNSQGQSYSQTQSYSHKSAPQQALEFSKSFMENRESQSIDEPKLKAISQVANSYIVAQNSEGLIMIDQHAGHERVRYEQLMDQFEKQEKSKQALLLPHSVELSHEEAIEVSENLNIFEELGFEIEPFGGKTFVVNAVPKFFANESIDDVFKGVLDDIINSKNPSKFQGKTEEIITYMSCRSAIKFGQILKIEEMQSLIEQMDKLVRPYTCPHGRPTMISITLSELEKMFGRK